MATEVVSGRVDADVKRRADAYIKKEGLTTGEVIRIVWDNIAATGEVPKAEAEGRERPNIVEFFTMCDQLPHVPEFSTMTKEQMRDLVASRYE